MPITLVTGAPRAGKTVYAVARLMREQVGQTVTYENQLGETLTAKRRICAAGFPRLLVEHVALPHPLTGEVVLKKDIDRWNKLDENDEPVMKRMRGEPAWTHELVDGKVIPIQCTIFNWWLWCEPGDFLAFDEVQYVIPRGTMGRVPPFYIKAMEIHGHYGVDFLLITQHPQLIDMTIRSLVNPHRHVRAVSIFAAASKLLFGGVACAVYVWDHASNPERYTTAYKERFIRKPEFFKLYHSTVAVTKQPAASAKIFYIAPLVLIACGYALYDTFKPKAAPPKPSALMSSAVASPVPTAPPARTAARGQLAGFVDVPKLSGCYAQGSSCTCYDVDGMKVSIAYEMCKISSVSYDGLIRWEKRPAPVPAVPPPVPARASTPTDPLKAVFRGGPAASGGG